VNPVRVAAAVVGLLERLQAQGLEQGAHFGLLRGPAPSGAHVHVKMVFAQSFGVFEAPTELRRGFKQHPPVYSPNR
jgi:hypothetical protein